MRRCSLHHHHHHHHHHNRHNCSDLVRRWPLTKMVLMPEAGEICFLDIVGNLQVVKLCRSAILPVKEDSGYQIFSAHRLTVQPKSSAIVESCLTVRHVMGGGVYGKSASRLSFPMTRILKSLHTRLLMRIFYAPCPSWFETRLVIHIR